MTPHPIKPTRNLFIHKVAYHHNNNTTAGPLRYSRNKPWCYKKRLRKMNKPVSFVQKAIKDVGSETKLKCH